MAKIGKNKKILAIIPARGGSKRIPRKNLRNLLGKPLIAYTIEAAQKSKYINRVVVSTEDKEIVSVSEKFGAEVINRPKELSEDESQTIDAVLHALDFLKKKNYQPNICILLQPTSPLREPSDIDNAMNIFLENKCDLVVSFRKDKSPNGAIYIFTPKTILLNKDFYAGVVLPYIMPDGKSIDIDEESDFKLVEKILENENHKNR